MTELQLRQKYINKAISFIGAKEGSSKHKEIINTFNTHPNLRYKMTTRDAWCATAVSAWSIMCDIQDIFAIECSCNKQISMWKSMGRWQENDAYVPEIGDIMYYDWDDYGSGDNKGEVEHVGAVVSVSGNTITVIEGNKNNAVEYRTMKVNGRYIRGYGLPDYASKATDIEDATPSSPSSIEVKVGDIVEFNGGNHYNHANAISGVAVKASKAKVTDISESGKHPYHLRAVNDNGIFISGVYGWVDVNDVSIIKNNIVENVPKNRIDTVKEVQNWANTNYKSGLVVDGIYGSATKKALVKIFQTEVNQTYGANLVVDGIWGAKTRAACPVLKYGSKNDVVGALQALLICNGYSGAYLDKDYGSATTSAVKSYQRKYGLVVDGEAGKNTFAKLCG